MSHVWSISSIDFQGTSFQQYSLKWIFQDLGKRLGIIPICCLWVQTSLVPHLKAAKKSGRQVKLVYDKLYIDGQLFKQSTQGTSSDTGLRWLRFIYLLLG